MSTESQAVEEEKIQLVTFSGDDPEDPVNWPTTKKVVAIIELCVLAFCSVFGSSSYAPGQQQLERVYGINDIAASSGLTLYVLGFAVGPLVCQSLVFILLRQIAEPEELYAGGPMSEMYGRKSAYMLSWPLMIGAITPSAFANDIVVILLFRFLTGCCAACALNNGSGVITDMYHNDIQAQSRAIAWYSFCPLSGPCFGSLVGFFVAAATDHGSSLWVVRVHFFFALACWPLVFLLPETHGPSILAARAQRLRAQGQSQARAAHEVERRSRMQIVQKHILRPTRAYLSSSLFCIVDRVFSSFLLDGGANDARIEMLLYEPINQGAAIWISLAYGIIYFFFEAYPVVFIIQVRNRLGPISMSSVFPNLTLRLSSSLTNPAWHPVPAVRPALPPDPARPAARRGPRAPADVPVLVCLSGFRTSGPETHWIAPALAGIAFGYSMMAIFMCFLAYVSQTYTVYASSASACNVFVRSVVASAFPVFANSLLRAVGTKWGVSLFGFLSLGLIPIPLFFIRYGETLRARSKFAREAREVLELMKERKEGLAEEKTQVAVEEADAVDKTEVEVEADVVVREQESGGELEEVV
ncbi:hypothetical protein EW146_g1874 [Bondarzewia mesenterica]|uniref:Major facilitator superfamily (MFS) profile domain-containing protein n=1 Tax=Bondarzewia mesenterica TaxID=1095465 RepID=A0A4V6S1J6_9AGAM|nr:hypothetical protein EW146_g1874 [Bondarzewia mesenterica]